ncbi:MAG TPA: PAS domain S-box protein [Anaerolineae bacterium]
MSKEQLSNELTEQALHRPEQQLKALVENGPDIICRYGRDLRPTYVYPTVGPPTGHTNGQPSLAREVAARFDQNIRAVFETGLEKTIEFDLATPGGQNYYEARLAPEFAQNGMVESVLTIARDITTRVQVEKALRLSEERYALAVKAGRVGIWAWNLETNECYLAPNLNVMLGVEEHKIRNHIDDWKKLIHPGDRERVMAAIEAHLAGKAAQCEVEHRMLHLDGTTRWFLTRATAIRGTTGKPAYVMGTDSDITERKRAAEERDRLLVAEQEQRLLAETLTEATLALTSRINHADVLDEILRQVQRLVPFRTAHIMLLEDDTLQIAHWYGYQASGSDELVANLIQPLADFPVDAKIVRSRQSIVIKDTYQEPGWVRVDKTAWIRSYLGVPIHLRDRVVGLLRLDSDTPGEFSTEDAKRLQPLANAAAVALENARLFQQAQQEIAERKQAEQRLRFQAQLLDSVRESIVATDLEGTIIYWGKGAKALYGYAAGEVIGQSRTFILKPEEKDEESERLRQVHEKGFWRGQYYQQRKDGSSFWVDSVISLVKDQGGQPHGFIEIGHDISHRKQAEEQIKNHNLLLERAVQEKTSEMELLTEQLIRQEKLATIGKISASIAHELRNPLGAIKQSIFFLNRLYARGQSGLPDPKVKNHLDLIETELHTTGRVISDLLEMTRLKPTEQEQIDLQTVLLEVAARANLEERIQLRLDFDRNPFLIEVDPLQIRQVFINLLINAADASPQGGEVMVKAQTLIDQNQCQIEIRDKGHGIDTDTIDKVFEPLYTSKVKGSGLGLTICKQITENHGGKIFLNSKIGQGTTVRILIPHQSRLANSV